jgi:hypothetical protein
MNLFEREFNLKGRGECIYLFPIYDVHYGCRNCNIKQFQNTVRMIAEMPNAYWFGGGDMIEAINPSDKRFNPQNVDQELIKDIGDLNNLVHKQADGFIKMTKHIKDKCLFLLEGNHEEKVKLNYHLDITSIIAHELNTVNLGYTAYGKFKFIRDGLNAKNVKIFASHGDGAGQTTGAKLNRLEKKGEWIIADAYFMGHNHGLITSQEIVLDIKSQKKLDLMERQKLYCVCGTYLKTYGLNNTGYGEKVGYKPTPTGSPKIKMIPFNCTHKDGKMIEYPVKFQTEIMTEV